MGEAQVTGQYLAKLPGDCCTKGCIHKGNPRGAYETIAGVETYVVHPPPERANGRIVLYFADIFGLYTNGLLVMDSFADAGYLALGLDYFDGVSALDTGIFSDEASLFFAEDDSLMAAKRRTQSGNTSLRLRIARARATTSGIGSTPALTSMAGSTSTLPLLTTPCPGGRLPSSSGTARPTPSTPASGTALGLRTSATCLPETTYRPGPSPTLRL